MTITVEGRTFRPEEIEKILTDIPVGATDYKPLVDFLKEWFSEESFLTVQTSGSTGVPKQIKVCKEKMINSACMTCSYLGLQKGMRALLCMDLKYIGAKMMVVRALVSGMDLIIREASGHPLSTVDKPIHFTAMVPLQIYNSLQIPEEKEILSHIQQILIGGSQIDPQLEKEIRQLPNAIYSTYGMTETLSHIALRKLTGTDHSDLYTTLSGIQVSLSDEQTLVIHAPALTSEIIYTNDIAELSPGGKFRILGRKDNIINSGGIKIFVEQLESQLSTFLPFAYAITSVPDTRLGEMIVLLIACSEQEKNDVVIPSSIPSIHRPKHIFSVPNIPLTKNGKKDRFACHEMAQTLYKILKLREK